MDGYRTGFLFASEGQRKGLLWFIHFAVLMLIVGSSLAVTPTSLQLNHTLNNDVRVSEFALSADGAYVVYRVDGELYSVDTETKNLVRLNPLANNEPASAHNYQISPDSSSVVFLSYRVNESSPEIFSVPIAGGELTKLFFADDSEWTLLDYDVVGIPSYVLYTRTAPEPEPEISYYSYYYIESYSIPVSGGEPKKIYDDSVNTASSIYPVISVVPNHPIAIFNTVNSVFSVPITGGAPIEFLENSGFSYSRLARSTDGSLMVFISCCPLIGGGYPIYSDSVYGGNLVNLNPGIFSSGSVDVTISLDGSYVVLHGTEELFSVPSGGGMNNQLSPVITNGQTITSAKISPSNQHVAFLSRFTRPFVGSQSEIEATNLLVNYLNGSPDTSSTVNVELGQGQFVSEIIGFDKTGFRIVYIAAEEEGGVEQIFSASINSPTQDQTESVASLLPVEIGRPIKLNQKLSSTEEISDISISPDGKSVVYKLYDTQLGGRGDLYIVSIYGGGAKQVNSPVQAGYEILDYEIDPSRGYIYYLANLEGLGHEQLYQVDIPNLSGEMCFVIKSKNTGVFSTVCI